MFLGDVSRARGPALDRLLPHLASSA
jgi:hypothetical protein